MPNSRQDAPAPMPTPASTANLPDVTPAPWERQPGEGAKAYAAFESYKLLGVQRSITRVAASLGRHPSLIRRWCQRHRWVERALAWDGEQARQVEGMLAQAREQALKRRIEAGEQVEKLGMLAFQSLIARDPETGKPRLDDRVRPRDAVALYRLAMEIHRSLPQATEAPAVTVEKAEQERLRQLSDEELTEVMALLQQRQQTEVQQDEQHEDIQQPCAAAVD